MTINSNGVPASDPSSANASPNSTPSNSNSPRWDKIHQADYLRLMADNQEVLELQLQSDQTHRQQTAALRAAQASQLGMLQTPATNPTVSQPANPTTPQSSDSMPSNIAIDSPTNHYYPQAAAQPAAPATTSTGIGTGTLATILAGVLGAAGLGAGGAYLATKQPTTAPIVAPANPAPTNSSPANPVVTNPGTPVPVNLGPAAKQAKAIITYTGPDGKPVSFPVTLTPNADGTYTTPDGSIYKLVNSVWAKQ